MRVILLSLLIGLISAAPITDAVEDLTTFDYEDMAANVGIRRLLTTPTGAYYFLRAFLAGVEMDLATDRNMRDLMKWTVFEYRKSFERHTIEL